MQWSILFNSLRQRFKRVWLFILIALGVSKGDGEGWRRKGGGGGGDEVKTMSGSVSDQPEGATEQRSMLTNVLRCVPVRRRRSEVLIGRESNGAAQLGPEGFVSSDAAPLNQSVFMG